MKGFPGFSRQYSHISGLLVYLTTTTYVFHIGNSDSSSTAEEKEVEKL